MVGFKILRLQTQLWKETYSIWLNEISSNYTLNYFEILIERLVLALKELLTGALA